MVVIQCIVCVNVIYKIVVAERERILAMEITMPNWEHCRNHGLGGMLVMKTMKRYMIVVVAAVGVVLPKATMTTNRCYHHLGMMSTMPLDCLQCWMMMVL